MKSVVLFSLGVLLVVLTFTSCVQAKKFTIKDPTSNKVCAIVEVEFKATVTATKGDTHKDYTFDQDADKILAAGACGSSIGLNFNDNTAVWSFTKVNKQIHQSLAIFPSKMFSGLNPKAQATTLDLQGLNTFKLGDKSAYQCSKYKDESSNKKGTTYSYKAKFEVKSIKIQVSEVKDEKFSTDVVKCPNGGTRVAGGLMATLAAIVALAVKSS